MALLCAADRGMRISIMSMDRRVAYVSPPPSPCKYVPKTKRLEIILRQSTDCDAGRKVTDADTRWVGYTLAGSCWGMTA